MIRQSWAVAVLMLRNLQRLWAVAGVVVGFMVAGSAFSEWQHDTTSGPLLMGAGLWFFLVPILAGVGVSFGHLPSVLNLGARRASYFWGAALVYVLLSVATSLVDTVLYYVVDRPLSRIPSLGGVYSFADRFGWSAHGPLSVFGQQLALLLLMAAIVNLLAMAVTKWVPGAGSIIAAGLAAVMVSQIWNAQGAFQWLRFPHLFVSSSPALQIPCCLVLAAAFYALTWPLLAATRVPVQLVPAVTAARH